MNVCEWFAGCRRTATGTVRHPILGDVPTCPACAGRLGLRLVELACSRCQSFTDQGLPAQCRCSSLFR